MAEERKDGPATQRRFEADSLRVLGIFFLIFAALVLLGILWEERERARIVSAGAGALLFAIGAVMLLFSRKLRRRP